MDEASQPQTASAPRDNSLSMQRPVIISILYLANFVLGVSVFIGVILAYVWRGEERTSQWEQTHFTYLIRTFWIGLAISLVFALGWFGLIFGTMATFDAGPSTSGPPGGFFVIMFGGMLVFVLCAAWFAIRSILSLVKAGERRPMPNPKALLF
ncbi:DUF4870 family protein [Aurantiacibacter sediminis]|uniref:Transmembrane protein n=1 Tax=Aurantiacibacter sediminis TaxID=2793064 RepID=A0ABS0MZI7_9SPHN|nr:hypothetical protein [Aurantiacibacter sediminis]MBH5321120.1 hypothetical protein [Aurantiacibacter sediminis]